jgi:hypothetical protein
MTTAASPARVVHRIPGRMRVRFARGSITPEALARLQSGVLKVRGVTRCEANRTTGCLLVHFDEAGFDAGRFSRAVGGLADDRRPRGPAVTAAPVRVHDGGPSHLARVINVRLRLLDRRLRRATGDRVDLRTIVPIGFAGLAIREIVVNSAHLPAIPWYVLAWYAFDSYLKLQDSPTGQVTHSLIETVAQAMPEPAE